MANVDYYTVTYQHVHSLIKTALVGAELIKTGQMPDLSQDDAPAFNQAVQAADLPNLLLTQGTHSFDAYGPASSNTDAVVVQQYPMLVDVEDMRVVPINLIKRQCDLLLVKHQRLSIDVGGGEFLPIDWWRKVQGQDHQVHVLKRVMQSIVTFEVQMRLPLSWLSAQT